MPPFPRIRLNQTIKKLGWIPTEVQVEMSPNGMYRNAFKATSKHVMTEGLSVNDQRLVAGAKKKWLQFKRVDLTEYRGLGGSKKRVTVAKNELENATSSTNKANRR